MLTDPSTLIPRSNTETKSDEMETLNTTGITKVNADFDAFHTRTDTASRGGAETTPTMYEQSVIDAQRKVKGLDLVNRSFNNEDFDFVTEPLHETRPDQYARYKAVDKTYHCRKSHTPQRRCRE